MKNMLDGYGRQLKSPKSKKFRGPNRDTLSSPIPNHFHPSSSRSQNLFNYLEVRAKLT